MRLLFSPYLSLVLAHRFAKWRKTIFKLKFINLLMIAVVAAFYLGEYRKRL
jgi:hypothetical protein